MRLRPRLVGLLWRWHRRLGLFAALLAVMLAVTGIALNHTSEWEFDQRFVKADWVYKLYGERAAELPAYRAGEHWLFRSAEGRLYLEAREVASCDGELVGGHASDGLIYAACIGELLLLMENGELVESVTATMGLPVPLSGIGLADGEVVLRTPDGWLRADLDALTFDQPARPGVIVEQGAPGALPEGLKSRLPLRDRWLSWERLLLDLHSGRLGGRAGVWLVDIAGLLLCFLGISGVAMWWLHRRRGRR